MSGYELPEGRAEDREQRRPPANFSEAIDRIGLGPFQTRLMIMCGMVRQPSGVPASLACTFQTIVTGIYPMRCNRLVYLHLQQAASSNTSSAAAPQPIHLVLGKNHRGLGSVLVILRMVLVHPFAHNPF